MRTSRLRPVVRAAAVTAGVLVVVGAWGAFAVARLGYAWPYPQVLPGTISFHGATYFKQPGCHSRRWWEGRGGSGGAQTAGRVGTLTSAVGVGGMPEYGPHRAAFDGYLLVPAGGCYVEYEANASGD